MPRREEFIMFFKSFTKDYLQIKTGWGGQWCGTWSLPIREDPGSNPVISNLLNIYLLLTDCRKDKNKGKEAVNGPFKNSSGEPTDTIKFIAL